MCRSRDEHPSQSRNQGYSIIMSYISTKCTCADTCIARAAKTNESLLHGCVPTAIKEMCTSFFRFLTLKTPFAFEQTLNIRNTDILSKLFTWSISYHVNTMHAAAYHAARGARRRARARRSPSPGRQSQRSLDAARYGRGTHSAFPGAPSPPSMGRRTCRLMHMTPPHFMPLTPPPPRRFFTAATKPSVWDRQVVP